MSTLDRLYVHYTFKAKCAAKDALNKFLKDERGDVNVVSIVVLIAVAVTLALFFKDKIAGILGTLIDDIEGKAGEALDDV